MISGFCQVFLGKSYGKSLIFFIQYEKYETKLAWYGLFSAAGQGRLPDI